MWCAIGAKRSDLATLSLTLARRAFAQYITGPFEKNVFSNQFTSRSIDESEKTSNAKSSVSQNEFWISINATLALVASQITVQEISGSKGLGKS